MRDSANQTGVAGAPSRTRAVRVPDPPPEGRPIARTRSEAPASPTAPLAAAWLAVLCLFAIAAPSPAAAQMPPSSATTPGPDVRVYVGLWTTHFRDISRGLRQNWLIGLTARGWYGGTFINSFGNRSFTVGVQRTMARGAGGSVIPSVGYRLGIVTGYDERFWSVAGKIPVLPFPQLMGGLDSGNLGMELGLAPLVATLGPNFFF